MTTMEKTDFGLASGLSNRWMLHFYAAAILAIVAGGYAVMNLFTIGHAAFNTTNEGVFWGLPIVTYDYFLLTSTGLAMVAGLYHVLGIEAFRPVARRALWLALAGLIGGVAVLFLELGDPILALIATPMNMQIESPLFWKVLLVGAYAVLLVVLLLGSIKNPGAGRNPLAMIVAALAFLITLVAGAVYGLMAMRPMWFGGEIPVVFLIESLVGGLAFVVFFSHLAYGFDHGRMSPAVRSLFEGQLARLFAIAISLHFVLHAGRAITGLWSNAEGLQVWDHMVASPLFHAGLWGGTLLPLALVALPSTRTNGMMQLAASVLVMVGLLISRYEFIISGQIVPLFKGSWVRGLIDYTPSGTEWALLAFAVGIANAVYAFAAWKLGAEDQA